MVAKTVFGRHVRNALLHFHDTAYMQTCPLVGLFRLDGVGAKTEALLLRELIAETVEELRPTAEIVWESQEWIPYRLLRSRYLASHSVQAVCDEIGFASASYYRYHRTALDALISLLWDRSCEEGALSEDTGVLAQREAVRLAQESARVPVDLYAVINLAASMVEHLANQRGVRLVMDSQAERPEVFSDPAMLRHLAINVLAQGIKHAASDVLRITVTQVSGQVVCHLAPVDPAVDRPGDLDLASGLVAVYGGRVWFELEEGGGRALCFEIPVAGDRAGSVLIVDDDRDTVRLYQHFLQAHGYFATIAQDALELEMQLEEQIPDLILLDMLIPHKDGWSILADLAGQARTQSIPIVVCSIISQPELAVSMGATKVLCKPIREETLITTIQEILARD